MVMNKVRLMALALTATGVAVSGIALLARQVAGAQEPNTRTAETAQPSRDATDTATGRNREAALRPRSVENMKTIALALRDYHAAHGSFPPAALLKPGGKATFSWRVAILPYLGQKKLYDQYRFDEPWDSPHNRELLEKVPTVFRAPGAEASSTATSYFVLSGPQTIFSDKEGTALDAIRDGAPTTILFVEVKRPIPWTKPEDIPYSAEKPLPELGGYYDTCAGKGAFHAAFADGSVRLISGTMDEVVLRALISKAGGEKLTLP